MTSNTTPSAEAAPSTPDPIQAAADKLQMELNITTTQEDMDDIRSVMRELVAEYAERERAAIASWDEERKRALREADRVVVKDAENARIRERVAELEELVSDLNGSYDGGRLDMIADWHDARLKREGRDADLKSGRSDGAVIRATIGHIRELESQLAAARRDAERLDWLEASLYTLWASGLRCGESPPVEISAKAGRFEADSIRAAIDAAMQREAGK
jgi:hypothetical protein